MLSTLLHLLVLTVLGLLLPIRTVCFTPIPVYSAAGRLVKNTIWIFGGEGGNTYVKSLWSLDVSQPFSLSSPPWTDHSNAGANQAFLMPRQHTTIETGA